VFSSAKVPVPAVTPAPPAPGAETAGPSVPVLGVGTVAAEVARSAALIASHTGVEPPSVPSPGARQGHRHSDSSAADVRSVQLTQGLRSIFLVSVDHEGEAGDRAGHEDLSERPVLPEHPLQVPLGRVLVQIGHVEPTLVLLRRGAAGIRPRPPPTAGTGPPVAAGPRPPAATGTRSTAAVPGPAPGARVRSVARLAPAPHLAALAPALAPPLAAPAPAPFDVVLGSFFFDFSVAGCLMRGAVTVIHLSYITSNVFFCLLKPFLAFFLLKCNFKR